MEAYEIFETVLGTLLEEGKISPEDHAKLNTLDGFHDLAEAMSNLEADAGGDVKDFYDTLQTESEARAAVDTAIAGLALNGDISQETADALSRAMTDEGLAMIQERLGSVEQDLQALEFLHEDEGAPDFDTAPLPAPGK